MLMRGFRGVGEDPALAPVTTRLHTANILRRNISPLETYLQLRITGYNLFLDGITYSHICHIFPGYISRMLTGVSIVSLSKIAACPYTALRM
jgi:hypothetical protein